MHTNFTRAGKSLLAAFALAAPLAVAQTYPSKPVRYLIPYAAGGGTDTVARAIGQKLSEALRQPVLIDNRPGAGGNIATEMAVKAPPDGYTIVAGNIGPMAINPHLYKLSYNPATDLAPITLIALAPLVVVTHPSLPVKSLKELIALARAHPGRLNYASAGVGSSNHLAGVLFDMLTGAKTVHVPYKGAAPALSDLLGGQVMLSFATMPSAMAQVRSGRLRVLSVTAIKRSSAAPEVPTSAEAGLPGFEVAAWYSVLAPKGTSRPIIDRLNREIVKALAFPDVKERLTMEGAEQVGNTPEQFGEFIHAETAKWAKVIKASGMKAD